LNVTNTRQRITDTQINPGVEVRTTGKRAAREEETHEQTRLGEDDGPHDDEQHRRPREPPRPRQRSRG
jgi:hypothetical protein